MLRTLSLLSFLLSTLHGSNAQNTSTLPDVLDAETIASLGNNSLFTRWRPISHFSAPAGWMNDPCGMMYDPTRDEYHLMYQWHPNHIDWGNISWGHATSRDLITWTDVGGWEGNDAEALVTGPPGSYNGLGMFSGTAQSVNLQGEQDGTLLAFYTAVSKLPTNWRIPYQNGTETQSLAISNDGGQTWEEYENNPVITKAGTLQAGATPSSNHGRRWTRSLASPSPTETGTYAFNFEVSNFFSLVDEDGDVHYYTLFGAEGGNTALHPRASAGLWNEGIVTRRANGSAQFTPVAGGAIDSGLLYAVTSFNDTKNSRRVQWGWAVDELNQFVTQQGFNGAFALPREMYAKKTRGLINANGGLTMKGNNRVVEYSDGTYTAYTLAARPLPEVVSGIRNGTTQRNHRTADLPIFYPRILGNGTDHMEIKATFRNVTGPAGLIIARSPRGEEYTTIYWNPSNYTINVDRSHSSTIDNIALNYTVVGYFYPYTFAKTGMEDIVMNVFIDGSLVELYINDRFWLTTRIYPGRTDSTGFGIYVDDGNNTHTEVPEFISWVGTANVFPERPLNSSSQLVFDTAEQTNNYTWWPGR
ncbi:hypothetical protein PMIN04_004889 [Paraphaeosphaeria minitans]